tara:strand:+ start:145 stop:300 length:156 start_codon:yes stop_codon:yes gene_type:complete
METELTEITKQLNTYLHSADQEHRDYAEIYLRNVHRKYGTVDTQIIKNIIR